MNRLVSRYGPYKSLIFLKRYFENSKAGNEPNKIIKPKAIDIDIACSEEIPTKRNAITMLYSLVPQPASDMGIDIAINTGGIKINAVQKSSFISIFCAI